MPTPIPYRAKWEANMTFFADDELGDMATSWEYDGGRVFYNVADYTGDSAWNAPAAEANAVYRGIWPNHDSPGYYLYTHGQRLEWERTSNSAAKTYLEAAAVNGLWTNDTFPNAWIEHYGTTRELSYGFMAYIDYEKVGNAKRTRYDHFLNQMIEPNTGTYGSYVQQYFTSQTWQSRTLDGLDSDDDVKPWMIGLMMRALIEAHEWRPDSRIPPAIRTCLDGLYDIVITTGPLASSTFWQPTYLEFPYSDDVPSLTGSGRASGLNSLIAPAYAWYALYAAQHPGNGDPQTYLARFRDIFAGGVMDAVPATGQEGCIDSLPRQCPVEPYLYLSKQMNQNYIWSPRGVEWYEQAESAESVEDGVFRYRKRFV